MPDDNQPPSDGKTREFLAITVSVLSLLMAFGLAINAMRVNKENADQANRVLATLLPLIGTWVGTVLAFYFTKANFESAARSVADMAKQVSSQDKLKSASVQSKMIPRDKMFFKTDPIDNLTLASVLTDLQNAGKGDRIPVLTDKNAPKYIIHRSMLDRYIAEKATSGGDVKTLTFASLFADKPDFKTLFASSFATVKPDVTLADVQAAMEGVKNCEDVFVTSQGTPNDEVIGWITDNIIQQYLQA